MLYKLVLTRYFIVGACLGLLLARRRTGIPGLLPETAVLLAAFASNTLFLLATPWVRRAQRYVTLQLFADTLTIAVLVYLSGGVMSPYAALFYAVVLGASVLLPAPRALLFSSTQTIVLCAVMMLYLRAAQTGSQLPLLDHGRWVGIRLELEQAVTYTLAHGLALHLAAALAGRLAQRALDEQDITTRIIEHLDEGCIVVDREGRVLAFNRRARELLGFAGDELLEGQTLDRLLRRQGDQPLRARLLGGTRGAFELDLLRRDAQALPLAFQSSLLPDARGDTRATITLIQDLSDRRNAERLREEAAAQKTERELAAGIAHEIRNPLASIQGCMQELAELPEASDLAKRLADIVVRESKRLDRIIESFMTFSRLPEPRPVPMDLRDALDDVAELTRRRAGDQAHIETRLARAPCLGDVELVKQALFNLALNAVQAAGGGGRVRLSCGANGRGSFARVEDSGPGVADQDRERIFEPFFSKSPEGTGLGLPMVRRIVHGLDYRLTITRSAELGGACFEILAPGKPSSGPTA